MECDESGDMFRFRVGQKVHWASDPMRAYYVWERQCLPLRRLPPLVQYRLLVEHGGDAGLVVWAWVVEEYLQAWKW